MSNESIEVRIARLELTIDHMKQGLDEDRQARKEDYLHLRNLTNSVLEMGAQMKQVHATLASNAPTIAEFVEVKHQVQGAGKLGRWIYAAAGVAIGALVTFKEAIAKWILST